MRVETRESKVSTEQLIFILELCRDEVRVRKLLNKEQPYYTKFALAKLLRVLRQRRKYYYLHIV
jgi:hypothetical protein